MSGHATVRELLRGPSERRFVAVRFVLDGATVTPVEVAPGGLAWVSEALRHGLPNPDGRGPNVPLAAGLAFLEALPEGYGRAVGPLTHLPRATALAGRDPAGPPPELTLRAPPWKTAVSAQLGPEPVAVVVKADGRIGLGATASDAVLWLGWREGWVWGWPGLASRDTRLLGGRVTDLPEGGAPIDPTTELRMDDLGLWLSWDVPPSARPAP
jgi:hypothetical protein